LGRSRERLSKEICDHTRAEKNIARSLGRDAKRLPSSLGFGQFAVGDGLGLSNGLAIRLASSAFGLGLGVGLPK
jgi:hypothetical protein